MPRIRRSRYVPLLVLLAIASTDRATCQARYRILSGQADSDGCFPKSPARICLGSDETDHCYSPASDKDYVFGLEPEAESIGMLWEQPLTLFSAMFSACGSGTLTDYSVLAVRNGEFVNLLPKLRLTNQSERKIWNMRQISPLPIIVTADFHWNFKEGETHFSAHRYQVDAYGFGQTSGRYARKVSYQTEKKYPGLDNGDAIYVIEPERETILAKLRSRAN